MIEPAVRDESTLEEASLDSGLDRPATASLSSRKGATSRHIQVNLAAWIDTMELVSKGLRVRLDDLHFLEVALLISYLLF